jgi:hypothetical protein
MGRQLMGRSDEATKADDLDPFSRSDANDGNGLLEGMSGIKANDGFGWHVVEVKGEEV